MSLLTERRESLTVVTRAQGFRQLQSGCGARRWRDKATQSVSGQQPAEFKGCVWSQTRGVPGSASRRSRAGFPIFHNTRGPGITWGERSGVIFQVQQLEQPTFRVGWIKKQIPASSVSLGPKHYVMKSPATPAKTRCWARGFIFTEPWQIVWPNFLLGAWIYPRTRNSVLLTVWFTFGALRVRKCFLCSRQSPCPGGFQKGSGPTDTGLVHFLEDRPSNTSSALMASPYRVFSSPGYICPFL